MTELAVAFLVGFLIATAIFGRAYWIWRGRAKAAEGILLSMQKDLQEVLGW
jgi:hypothetical protein